MQKEELHKIYEKMLKKREARKSDLSNEFVPSCTEFCPELEKVERLLRNDISPFENEVMIKKYQRSSAGKEKPFPEDVRPFSVLKECMSYLYSLIPKNNGLSLELYKFIEDRSRAIRLDMTFQSLTTEESVFELEKMIRFYILSNKLINDKQFEIHLNSDQIRKMIFLLLEIYSAKNTFKCKEEFLCYFIFINLTDKNIYNVLSNFDYKERVNEALKLYEYFNQNDFYNFFKLFSNLDVLSKHILLQNKEIMWNKTISSLKSALIEQIEFQKISKLFYLEKEEIYFYFSKNFRIENEMIDFKSKIDLKKEVFYKQNSLLSTVNLNSFIFLGDLDYKLRKFIINEFIKKQFKRKEIKEKPIKLKKINKVKIKEIIKIIIIKHKIMEIIKRIKNFDTKLLLVHDREINNMLFIKKVNKTIFSKLNPKVILLENMTENLGLQFNLVLFSLSDKNCKMVKEKYFMLRKMVNNSNFWKNNLKEEEIFNLINEPKIKKYSLLDLLHNKEINESSDIIIKLIESGLNSDVLNDALESLHKGRNIEDCSIYFYEGFFN